METLTAEVNVLEQRNLEIIETVTSDQLVSMEKTRQIYLASIGKRSSRRGRILKSISAGSILPSMVDVTKCTTEQVKEIQL